MNQVNQVKIKAGSVLQNIDDIESNLLIFYKRKAQDLQESFAKDLVKQVDNARSSLLSSWWEPGWWIHLLKRHMIKLSNYSLEDSLDLYQSNTSEIARQKIQNLPEEKSIVLRALCECEGKKVVYLPNEWYVFVEYLRRIEDEYEKKLDQLKQLKNACSIVTKDNDVFLDVNHPFFWFYKDL
jgi:hypothetical protein